MSGFVLYDQTEESYVRFHGIGDHSLDVCEVELVESADEATRISGKHKRVIEKFLLAQTVTVNLDDLAFCGHISETITGMEHVEGLVWVNMNLPDTDAVLASATQVIRR